MATRPYPISVPELKDLLTLSPLSLTEIARRFKLSRSNLMGLLGGTRTISDQTLERFLGWIGATRSGAHLALLPGLHFWQVTSNAEFEALERAATTVFHPATPTLCLDLPDPDDEWVHLLLTGSTKTQILLSCRPAYFGQIRQRWPILGAPNPFQFFNTPYREMVAALGNPNLSMPSGATVCHAPEPSAWETHRDALDRWFRLARGKMGLDTTALPQIVPVPPEQSPATDKDPAALAVRRLTHRLDIAGAQHPDVADLPLFSWNPKVSIPVGMSRLDRAMLGDRLLHLARSGHLRAYLDTTQQTVWLVTTPKDPTPPPASGTSQRYLVLQEEGFRVESAERPPNRHVGRIVGQLSRF